MADPRRCRKASGCKSEKWKNYTRQMMNDGDNPPIGIVLCADKSDTLVEFTLPKGNRQIFAAKYLPYMPTKEELRQELNLDEFEKLE